LQIFDLKIRFRKLDLIEVWNMGPSVSLTMIGMTSGLKCQVRFVYTQ